MLNFFKTNHPSAVLFLFAYLIVLKLLLFILPISPDFEATAPLSEFLFKKVLGFIHEFKFWYLFISFLFVFIQALLLNQVFTKHRLVQRLNYVPAMCYLLITALFEEFSLLTPALAANLFLIFALDKMLSVYQEEGVPGKIFDAAFYVSIASLFYFPAALFFILVMISIFILKPFILKDFVVGLLGMLTPYFLIGTYFYWHDMLFLQWQNHVGRAFSGIQWYVEPDLELLIKVGLIIIALGIILAKIFSLYYKSIVEIRKIIVILLWYFVIALGTFILEPYLTIDHFVLLAVPLSAMLAYYFLHVRHRRSAEVVHLVILITILVFQYIKLFELELPDIF